MAARMIIYFEKTSHQTDGLACGTVVTPLLMRRSERSLALSHRNLLRYLY